MDEFDRRRSPELQWIVKDRIIEWIAGGGKRGDAAEQTVREGKGGEPFWGEWRIEGQEVEDLEGWEAKAGWLCPTR